MLLKGKNPRSVVVLVASTLVVLLIAGAAAAHDVAGEPEPTQVVIVEAAAAPVPAALAPEADASGARKPDPVAAHLPTAHLPIATSPTTGAAAPATVTPRLSTQPRSPAPTPTVAAPTTRVAPPPTLTPALPTPPPPPLQTVEIGPGAWRSTFEGITATLRMTPVAPRVGQAVQFSIDTTYTGAGCCMVSLYPGDGAVFQPEDNSMDCTRVPGSLHRELLHTYARADTFVVHVQPSILPCTLTPDGLPAPINAHLYASVTVAPAT